MVSADTSTVAGDQHDDAQARALQGAHDLLPDPGPTAPPRGRLRLWLAVGGVVALLAAVVALGGSDDRDPDKALAAAQATVERATSFRFTLSLDADGFDVAEYRDAVLASSPPGEADEDVAELGDGTLSLRGAGEFATPNWHVTGSSRFGDDEFHSEAVLSEGVLYQRYGSDADDLADAGYWRDEDYAEDRLDREEVLDELVEARSDLPFSAEEFPELAAQIDTVFAAQLYLSGFGERLGSDVEQDPRGYLDAVAALADPSVARTDGDRLTLRVHMTPSADVVDAFGDELPPADIELDLDGDDQPLALRLVLGASDMELRVELTFADWGADIHIDPPADDDIEDLGYDDTDGVDVEDIDPDAVEEVERPDGYEPPDEVPEPGDGAPGDDPAGARQSALTGDELRQLDLPDDLGLVRPAQVGAGLVLEEVVAEQVGDCTTVTIWYEGSAGYLVVWLSQERCAEGSAPDAVLSGTAVRIDTGDPEVRSAAIESLEPVTVEQLAAELDAAR